MDASTEVLTAIQRLESAIGNWEAVLLRESNAAGNNNTAQPAHLRAELDMMHGELARLRREFAVQLANRLRC